MADIAHLGFSVDTSGLVRAERAIESLDRAARGLRGVNLPVNLTGAAEARQAIDSISRTARGLRDISVRVNVDGRQANNELRGVASTAQQSAQQISQSITNVRSQMLGLVGATGVVAAGVNIIQMADEYKNLEAKLKLTTKSQQEFLDVQAKLMAMANANRQSMSATIDLYSGIAPSLQRAGQSQENILKAVDSVNKALVVGGSSATGSAAAILQLTQALGSGVLRGDEFNSIMENGRGIALMLADALHTDVGKLRGLAEQGKLTANIVTAALIEQNDAVSKKFATMPVTVGQAMQVVKNNLLSAVGSADAYTGASAALSDSLITLSKNLGTVAEIGVVLAAVYAGRGLSSLVAYVAANNAAAAAVQASSVAAARAVQATAAAQAESASASWAASAAKSRDAQATVVSTAAQVALTESLLAESLVQRSLADQVFLYGPQRAAIERGIAAARAQHTLAIEAQTVATAELAVAQTAATGASAEATAALAAQRVATAGVGSAMAGTSIIARGLAGSMALIGGPAGVAMLAGVGMYYFAEANNEAAKSIELANGQTLNFAETLDYVTDISNEYRTASTARQGAIREEIDNIIKLTAQRKAEAQQQLEYLNQLDAASAKAGAGSPEAFANSIKKGWADFFGLDQGEARAVIKESGAQLEALTKQQGDLGKPTDELTKKTELSAAAMLSQGNASKKAAEVLHAHGDAMQQATESITKRTLAVEHGTLAEQYYIERMKGVTDAEARRIVSGNQYLTYLEEQQSLTKDATAAHGGLLDAYRQKLDDAGLGSADKAFDAAKSSTDVAVDAAVKYRESIEAVTQAAKEAAAAVSNMSNAQPTNLTQGGSVGGISAGGGIASSSESAKIAAAAAKHPQVIAVIDKVAKETGTDPAVMKTMAYIESRFNDKAHNPSSASGVYQFVNGTAKQYGLSGKQFDAESNTRAYTKLLGDNASALKRYGIEVTGANLYLAHQQGAGGLKQIMDEASGKGSASAVIHKNMRGNPSGGDDSTAAGFLKGWTDKYNTLEASVKSATSKTADVSVQAGKVATETAKAVPIWDALNTKTAEAKSLTVEYGGVIEDKVVTAQMRANLEQQYMNGEAQKLIDTANEQAETIGKSGIAIRQNELNQKQFNVSQQAAIINAESALAYAEEEANLRKEMVAVKSPGLAAQYAAGLSDKTLTKDRIESLTGQKLQIEFTKNITELDGRAEKATLTAEAYQRLTLARDGFTESQINGQMAWQQEVIKLEDAAEANSRIAQSFESDLAGALKNGEFNFQNFADTVISEITRLQVIKPLMESLFGADKSGKSGLFGDSEGGIVQTIGSFLGFANGGAFAASGVQEYANGGAFHNSVLNKPTQFFANGGLAVAGEAGSEAVMPLTRIGGKLGVQSTGANVTVQPQIKINIVNNAGAKVETQQQTDNDGNINMTVMINQIEGAISDRARRGQGLANVFKRVG